MYMQSIAIDDLQVRIHHLWDKGWFLLTAGDFTSGAYNSMTISWGGMGILWGKAVVQVVVRPSRFTFGFMEANSDFTLCSFHEKYRKALQLLGSKSGRDGDKIKQSGLTPCKSTRVTAPSFTEASLVLECRKIYADVFRPEAFIDPGIEGHYPLGDYHKMYIGEVLTVRGERDSFFANG